MISLFLFLLAAICNAVMDTSNHHFSTSIFKNLNPLFWNGEISWKNKYINGDSRLGRRKWKYGINYPVQLTDAFHLFKMLMIIFLAMSVITFEKSFFVSEYNLFSFGLILTLYGFVWNTTFSFFYNKVLR